MINSKEIFNELKKSVIGQDEYIKQLATIGYKHQLNLRLLSEGKETLNNNLLVIGPSGSGKTFAVKQLSKLIDVPFYEIDCSNIVQTGYKGNTNIETALLDAFNKLHSKVQEAIIYLDEFDKIIDYCMLAEGKGTGSQQNFLKILENNDVTVDRSRLGTSMNISTRGITFIATGSFESVKSRLKICTDNHMGFNATNKKTAVKLTADDLIAAGFIPELIGRFTKIININQLSKDDFFNIVKTGSASSLKQYKDMFAAGEVELNVDDSVYRVIADKAYNSSIGARGITNALSSILDDCLYETSSNDKIDAVKVCYKANKLDLTYSYNKSNQKHSITYPSITLNEVREYAMNVLDSYDIKVRNTNLIKNDFDSLIHDLDDKQDLNSVFMLLSFKEQELLEQLNNCSYTDLSKHECYIDMHQFYIDMCMHYQDLLDEYERGHKDGK